MQNNYQLEELKEKAYNYGIIRHKQYKVLNWDKNLDKLQEYVKQLNDESMFNVDYYIKSITDYGVVIEETIDTLDQEDYMYIYLTKINKSIVENALKSLDLNIDDYIEIIKEEECISVDNLIELLQNMNYKLDSLEEKMEDMKDEH